MQLDDEFSLKRRTIREFGNVELIKLIKCGITNTNWVFSGTGRDILITPLADIKNSVESGHFRLN